MADDIDIEEHDILDNPRIQDILYIKEEPIDIDHHYEEPAATYDEYEQYDYYQEDDQGQNDDQLPQCDEKPPDNPADYDPEPLDDPSDYKQQPLDDPTHYNQPPFDDSDGYDQEQPNELGSDSVFEDQDMNIDDPCTEMNESPLEDTECMSDLSNEIYHHNNKIILGTKPCKRPTRDVKGAYVSLDDWGVRLQNSDCYCKECQTLFATQNALDAHNMVAHSFLVALDSPASSESDHAVPEKSEAAKYCDHCKKYFPSDHALIQHLYDLITANKQTPAPTDTQTPAPTVNSSTNDMVYSCLSCNSVYVYIKRAKKHTISKHNKSNHCERIPFTGSCRFCTFTNKNRERFNEHVIYSHLPAILKAEREKRKQSESENFGPNDGTDLINEKLEQENQSSNLRAPTLKTKLIKNFKCIKCKSFFPTLRSIQHHQYRYHKGEKIIQRMIARSAVSKVKTTTKSLPSKVPQAQEVIEVKSKTHLPVKVNFVDNLVPKNSIFKCNDCSIHLVTCWSAILHTCIETSRYECDICCKQFRLHDTNTHLDQHKFNDAFNTYYISKNMNTKMLFWCQNCAVYFELKKIQSHLTTCKGTSSSIRCKLCEVDVNDVITHMNNHKIHPTKSDFIFIDDLLPESEDRGIPPEKVLKRRFPKDTEPGPSKTKKFDTMDSISEPSPSKIRKLEAHQFFYCEKCQTCMKITTSDCHLTGECKKVKSKRNCEFCGLVFFSGTGANSHEEYHRSTNAKLKDFTFINVVNNKPIVPLIPQFPDCKKCNVHDFTNHQCGSYKTCKTCNKKFSESAHKLHLVHHKHLRLDTKVMELIKKYETLSPTWNILYMCKICNVATDSYDDVVLHCQNHYNYMKEYTTRICDFCSFELEETCFKRHKELHSPSITKESFKIVVYDYKNLLNEDWLKLFGSLSGVEVHQIMSRSIYVTRFVRMKLILNGPPELTIYKCETCKLYVDPNSIYQHTTWCVSFQDNNRKLYPCKACLIPFSTVTAREDHEKLHVTPDITANSFRIVAFNDKSDRQFNSNLTVNVPLASNALEINCRKPIKVYVNKTKSGLKSAIFYQCRQCNACSLSAGKIIRHDCVKSEEIVKCTLCQLQFHTTDLKPHKKWHKKNRDITKDSIKIFPIDNNNLKRKHKSGEAGNKKPLYKLHQCKKCKICYSYWVKHTTCNKRTRQCKKCGYMFSSGSYEFHDLWHSKNVNATNNDIKVVPLAQEASAKSKMEKRLFLKSLNLDKEIVKDIQKPAPKPDLKRNQEHLKQLRLYQCHSCKVCSYKQAFVKKHTTCSVSNKGMYNCSTCNLKFKYIGMKFHKTWHKEHPNSGRKHINILPFKGTKILKIKDKNVCPAPSKSIVSDDDGYKCKKCGASSKKSIFLNKHKCSSVQSSTSPISSHKKSTFSYYQCEECEACFTHKAAHYCTPAHIVTCSRCKLKFSNKSIFAHMQRHSKFKNLTRSKFTLIPFKPSVKPDPVSEPVSKVSTVFKCSCGLHFISQKTIERHFTVCSPDHDIPSENCSKCGLLFPTNHLVSHLCNHHSYGKGNIEVKSIPTITHYRCGNCKCLFADETRVLIHNVRCDPSKVRSVHCYECQLDFHNTEIRMHKETHKLSSDLNKPCRILTINKENLDKKQSVDDKSEISKDDDSDVDVENEAESNKSKKQVEYDNNLYKCKDCGTHFLKYDTVRKHILGNCPVKCTVRCKLCGINFSKFSLVNHMDIQHEAMKLKRKDFVVNVIDSAFVIVSRLTLEESDIENDDVTDETKDMSEKKVNIFKCHICNTHYVTKRSFQNHYMWGKHNVRKTDCPKCGITFADKSFATHMTLHHNKMKLSGPQHFNVIERSYLNLKTREAWVLDQALPTKTVDSPIPAIKNRLNITQDEVDPSINTNGTIDITYYNCKKCSILFTNQRSLELHILGKHAPISNDKCELCNLSFTYLEKHKEHHRSKQSDVFFVYDVIDNSGTVNMLFKCKECGVHYTTVNRLLRHITNPPIHHGRGDQIGIYSQDCTICGLKFPHATLKHHKKMHHEDNCFSLEDFVIDTSVGKRRMLKFGGDNMISQSSSQEVNETREEANTQDLEVSPTNKSPVGSPKLYKCGKCNVYFLTQATCYKHIVKHTPMDPKEYIECKLCSFQFRIHSLNNHIRRHHKNDFEIDKVLIEEYQPKTSEEKVPKINIYYAKDKVQSRLVSTTTDDAVDSSVSQSQINVDDSDASNDSKDTVVITNTDDANNDCDGEDTPFSLSGLECRSDSKDTVINAKDAANDDCGNVTNSSLDDQVANDSKETVLITNSGELNTEMDVDNINKDVMVKIPSFSLDLDGSVDPKDPDSLDAKSNVDNMNEHDKQFKVKEENVSSELKIEGALESNEGTRSLNEGPSNEAESKTKYSCGYCSETFVTRRAKDFHENLDHLDAVKDCPICKKCFNTSVLDVLHLEIKNNFFTCCVCGNTANVDMLPHHAYIHNHIL